MLAGCCAPSGVEEGEEITTDIGIAPGVKLDEPIGAAADDAGEESLYCTGACGRRRAEGRSCCCYSCGLNPGLGFHDDSCGQDWDGDIREVCAKGSRCRDRSEAHLAAQAHPLDRDYAICCFTASIAGESLSCKVVFDWADADGSGKLSRKELETSMAQLRQICGSCLPNLSEESWKNLDEDGNGVVNFAEFASWAGPRVGLPLGMKKMMNALKNDAKVSPCCILNCPCEAFEPSSGDESTCKNCKHSKEHHRTHDRHGVEVPVPEYWDADGSKADEKNIVDVENARNKCVTSSQFQELLDKCHVARFTRDRKKHNPDNFKVPKGYKVVRVSRNENVENWFEFGCRRAELKHRVTEAGTQIKRFDDVKSARAFREVAGDHANHLEHDMNEWYLFHGTNPEIARLICESDFRVSCAGGNTGTLYGKGLYFAEAITKADEYAKPNALGNYAVILCRVLGGNVKYTDEGYPDPEALVQSCINGPYDCVLGDREKARGTFREFVIFDSEDVYPEYIIEYARDYGGGEARPEPGASPRTTGASEETKVEKLQRELAEKKARFGDEHGQVASAMTNLASAYAAEKQYSTAIDLFEQSIALKEKILGPGFESPTLAVPLAGLASAYGNLGQHAKQVELLERCLAIRIAAKGDSHPDLAPNLANLGVAYRKLGQPQEALKYVQRALKIKEDKFGPESAEVALTLGNLAQVYGDLKQTDEQRKLLMRALGIFERTRGPDHPHTQLARTALAGVA